MPSHYIMYCVINLIQFRYTVKYLWNTIRTSCYYTVWTDIFLIIFDKFEGNVIKDEMMKEGLANLLFRKIFIYLLNSINLLSEKLR